MGLGMSPELRLQNSELRGLGRGSGVIGGRETRKGTDFFTDFHGGVLIL